MTRHAHERAVSVIRRVRPMAYALAGACAGGAVFAFAGLPMPWLLGAIAGTACVAMGGARVRMPVVYRNIVLIVLGLMIGSTLKPGTLDHLSQWPVSLAAVVVYVAAVTVSQYLFLRRIGRYDAVTAYFSAAPGGFMAMTVIGGEFGGRERSIALNHAVRIVLVVFIIVIGYHLLIGYGPGNAQSYVRMTALSPAQLAGLCVTGMAGAGAGRLLRIPGAYMLGPLVAAAAAQLTGLLHTPVPTAPILVAEVVLGSSIGAQFSGVAMSELGRGFLIALTSTVFMLALSGCFSVVLHEITGLDLAALMLAFAPGGMSGISLIALALGIEPAFVTVHNMVRVLLILLVGPLLFRAGVKRAPGRSGASRD